MTASRTDSACEKWTQSTPTNSASPFFRFLNSTMTVINAVALTSSIPIDTMTSSQGNTNQMECMTDTTPPSPPSATEEEAKRRFNLALTKGVETLLGRGHGRGRASTELLNEIANGCSNIIDEEEVRHIFFY
jgi:hypothetical protein